LRLAWVFSISPNIVREIGLRPEIFTMVIAFLELLRRAIWNFLRVEKEHINNCANFKSID
jgi:hypothetical protein